MRLSKRHGDPQETAGRINRGRMLVTLDRGDYWQCAFVIRKDGFAAVRARGLDAFRADIVTIAPFLRDRVDELRDWDDVKLLTVDVDRLERWWRPGLLCIGDARTRCRRSAGSASISRFRTLSPRPTSWPPRCATARGLRSTISNACSSGARFRPAMTQRLQMVLQDQVMTRVLAAKRDPKPPLPVRMLNRFAFLRRIPARIIGIGFRPEHVRSPVAPEPIAVKAIAAE